MTPNTKTEKNDTLWTEAIEAGKAFDLFPKEDYKFAEDYYFNDESTEDTDDIIDTCRGFIKENHAKELNSLSAEQQDNVLVMATWLYETTGNLHSLDALERMSEQNFNNKKTPKGSLEKIYQEDQEFQKSLTYGGDALEGKAKWLNVLRNHPLKKELFSFVYDYINSREANAKYINPISEPNFDKKLAEKTETRLEKYANLEITKQKASSNTKNTMLSPQLMTKIMGKTR